MPNNKCSRNTWVVAMFNTKKDLFWGAMTKDKDTIIDATFTLDKHDWVYTTAQAAKHFANVINNGNKIESMYKSFRLRVVIVAIRATELEELRIKWEKNNASKTA